MDSSSITARFVTLRLVVRRWSGRRIKLRANLEQFQKEFQCTHFIMLTQLPGLDPKRATRAFELFAKEVMPEFQKA